MRDVIRVAQVVGKWVGAGMELVALNYFRNIDKKRFQFDFICDEDSTNIPYNEIKGLGGRVILVPPYENSKKYIKALTNIFKNNKYDIVHSHTNFYSYLSLKAAKLAKIPVRIAHSHISSIELEDNKLIKSIYKPLLKANATDYFACSDEAARFMFGEKSFNNGEVTIINNAIDVDKFIYNTRIRNKTRQELGISDDKQVIGHIGRFISQKNHLFVLELFRSIHEVNPNTILLLVGQGPLMKTIRERAYTMDIYDDIKFLGQLKKTSDIYQAMDVFLLPSFYEGYPITLVEAESSGLYCVVSEQVGKKNCLLPSTDVLSLKSSINIWRDTIINGYANHERKNTGKIITKKGFNIKEEIKVLENKYIELIDKRK